MLSLLTWAPYMWYQKEKQYAVPAGIAWETSRAVSLLTLGADVSMYTYHPLAGTTTTKPLHCLLQKPKQQAHGTNQK